MGAAAAKYVAPIKHWQVEKDLDKKISEALKQRSNSKRKTFKTVNSITMSLPRLKDKIRNIKDVFDQYDADSNGTIDLEELRNCLSKLQVQLTEKESDSLYRYCDIDSRKGIQFHEFVVLLCLIYLLFGPDVTRRISEFESAQLNYSFDELIDAFLFFDKDRDGKMKRKDVTQRMNEASPQGRTPTHITAQLFREMDLNRNGNVNLKEFLFSMIQWAGLANSDDDANGDETTSP